MYFDASEHIANNTNYSRVEIEKIDEFLSGEHLKRFELRQLQEKTGISHDISPILEAYIREKILQKGSTYICPIHQSNLNVINASEGECEECNKLYHFDDCAFKIVYERISKPNKQKTSNPLAIDFLPAEARVWWKDPRYIITGVVGVIVIPIVVAVINVFSGDTIIINFPVTTTAATPSELTAEVTMTQAVDKLPTIEASPQYHAQMSTLEITPELTPESTASS